MTAMNTSCQCLYIPVCLCCWRDERLYTELMAIASQPAYAHDTLETPAWHKHFVARIPCIIFGIMCDNSSFVCGCAACVCGCVCVACVCVCGGGGGGGGGFGGVWSNMQILITYQPIVFVADHLCGVIINTLCVVCVYTKTQVGMQEMNLANSPMIGCANG